MIIFDFPIAYMFVLWRKSDTMEEGNGEEAAYEGHYGWNPRICSLAAFIEYPVSPPKDIPMETIIAYTNK